MIICLHRGDGQWARRNVTSLCYRTAAQSYGEGLIAIMEKPGEGGGEKYTALQQGSKIPQSVLAEQIETITAREIFSFGLFSLHPTSSVMKCMNARATVKERQERQQSNHAMVCSILEFSWFYEFSVCGKQRFVISPWRTFDFTITVL